MFASLRKHYDTGVDIYMAANNGETVVKVKLWAVIVLFVTIFSGVIGGVTAYQCSVDFRQDAELKNFVTIDRYRDDMMSINNRLDKIDNKQDKILDELNRIKVTSRNTN